MIDSTIISAMSGVFGSLVGSSSAVVNRIRLCSSKPVLIEAENVMRRITEQYFSPNLSLEEMRELARSLSGDPLEAFGAACRAELDKMLGRV
jgi:hypothetical protein